jgi:hypothetical protein
MPYKVNLWAQFDAIGWSQAAWRIGTGATSAAEMCEGEFVHPVMLGYLPKDGLIVDAGCRTAVWPIYLRARGLSERGHRDQSRRLHAGTQRGPRASARASGHPAGTPADRLRGRGSLARCRRARRGGAGEEPARDRLLKPAGILVLSVPFNNLFRRAIVNPLMTWVTWRRRRAQMRLAFAEYRFTRAEVQRHLADAGFESVAEFPDYHEPRVMGLWVDFDNLVFSPYRETPTLFILPGWRGRLARFALDTLPWLVCGGVIVVARAR